MIAVIVILLSIFVPYVAKMRELDHRASCANNLRALYGALSKYAAANNNDYPRSAFDPSALPHYVAFTGAAGGAADAAATPPTSAPSPAGTATAPPATAPATLPPSPVPTVPLSATPTTNPAAPPASQPTVAIPTTIPAASQPAGKVVTPAPIPRGGGRPAVAASPAKPNDVTAALWLLVRSGYASPESFVCASGDESVDPLKTDGRAVPVDQRYNFTGPQHLSYSYAYPFLDVNGKAQLNSDRLPPDFPLLADKNPGKSANASADPAASADAGPAYNASDLDLAKANSPNHSRAGQNVLYVTGEVRFQKTPYCGYGVPPGDPRTVLRDSLYTAYGPTKLPPGTVPADPQTTGVRGPAVGPAWAYDAYLVPAAEE